MIAAALVGPVFLPSPVEQPDIEHASQAPTAAHPMGTDQLSRDVMSRVANGARVSLAVAAIAVTLSVTLGALVGLTAGYFGGATDAIAMRIVDAALAIPRLFLLLLLLAMWETIPPAAFVLVVGVTGWFGTSRLVRAEVLRLRAAEYVDAARGLGAAAGRIMFRHLLPNALGPLLVAATLGVGEVILLEAGLSFLGLGLRPPRPSWGGMIYDGRAVLMSAPWASIFPALAITITVLSVNLIGDALREAVDPHR
ncbi:MAG: ABC transporter permease [Gemmatimonadales bacterium]|nr:ABC transporter permease [Gemmatimonadales bacterium]